MKEFPQHLNVQNKEAFDQIYYARKIAYLRLDIYERILRKDEKDYFELDGWCKKNLNNDKVLMKKMTDTIMTELELLGWTCKTSFGGSGLFVYADSSHPPTNCYSDGF